MLFVFLASLKSPEPFFRSLRKRQILSLHGLWKSTEANDELERSAALKSNSMTQAASGYGTVSSKRQGNPQLKCILKRTDTYQVDN